MLCKAVRLLVLAPLLVPCSCQKKPNPQAAIVVKIDGTAVTQQSFDAFRKMRRMYPTRMGTLFPGDRSDITLLVESQILASKAGSVRGEVASGDDWKWKRKYFPAQSYLFDVLDRNLGFTDKEIESYYKSHRETYKTTVKVTDKAKTAAVNTAPKDTSKAKARKDSVVTRDSTYIRPLEAVRSEVVEKMFFEENPPDTAFMAKHKKDSTRATVDTAAVKKEWIFSVRNQLPNFFMKKVYVKRFGGQFPQSSSAWYGKGKLIEPRDMEVILSWIPEGQRESYRSDTAKSIELAQWLLKWELFSKEAKKAGLFSKPEMDLMLDWALKVQTASQFVEKTLGPKARSPGASLDTSVCLHAYWDEQNRVILPPDTAGFHAAMRRYADRQATAALNGLIYDIRRKSTVTFLQPDWKDDLDKNPAKLLVQADSARDSGDSKTAEPAYETLVRSFPFTAEGKKAYAELAKVQTEGEKYRQAIDNYRLSLFVSDDKTKRCNTYFMIGFIYDEYLQKPDLAEVNYKWVLRNTPDCELADDAEFMMLHLDEPMTSVEELRGEAQRQGRKIDPSDTTADTLGVPGADTIGKKDSLVKKK